MARPAHLNPFRTACVHGLRFRYPEGDSECDLVRRLDARGGRGAIVGPHGSGKTTLCLELAERCRSDGLAVRALRYGDSPELRYPLSLSAWLREAGPDTAVFVDGAGHLGVWAWWRILRASRRAARVLVTAHRPCPLPTVLRTVTTAPLLSDLCAGLDQPISPSRCEALFDETCGDVRRALRRLYDDWSEHRL